MKEMILNIFLFLCIFSLGFAYGFTGREEIKSKTQTTDVDIGNYLKRATNEFVVDIPSMLGQERELARPGGRLPNVCVYAKRLHMRNFSIVKYPQINKEGLFEELEPLEPGNIFLEVAPFDLYVKTFWINQRT